MFCGSRGTGKTTCAKILAKAVNCENPIDGEPCNECASCRAINEERVLDVVEMDAASNNGVDHIRRLCDEVQFLPSEVKKRVYIIDEVHMLSTSAFNALLKTIEEPPAHVLFILATTEVNDIPATIMSRCQRFDFKRITPEIISKRLLDVAQKEGIPLLPDAASVVARLSDGALRDALSLLESLQGQKEQITADDVHALLGLGSRESIIRLCRAIAEQDAPLALSIVNEIYEKMSDFKEVIGEIISVYRDLLVIKSIPDYEKHVEGYANEIPAFVEIAGHLTLETILYQIGQMESFYSSYDRISTGKKASSEILILHLCKESLSQDPSALLSRISKLERALEGGAVPPKKKSPSNDEKIKKIEPLVSQPLPKEEVQSAPNGFEYAQSIKLKNLLQEIAYIKPWLAQIKFEQNGACIVVKTSSFIKGVLLGADAKNAILESAKSIDPSIEDVSFEEPKSNPIQESNPFEGL
jgi:DNA polymerase-3 subunit gamma/tau